MLNIYIYVMMMILLFLMFLYLSLMMNYFDFSIMIEWLLYSFNSVNIEFLIMMDWISSLFVSLIFLISSMVMFYSMSYMKEEKFINRFMNLVMLFVFSMIMMIISPNIVSILLGWDGLGLISYCLVIYYQNYSSYNSGMLTVLCNRMGDVGLLMCISMMLMYGSWNMFMMGKGDLIIWMLLIASFTKSAQIPFSSWLPMAMAAPTPVSALVHSSTLVTAGVYLMIRFNKILMMSELSKLMLFLSILTMFMSSLMANVEFDMKKIIALSTLSQLGLMMMILSLGLSILSFYHLLIHALFKSLLFLCVGVLIHSLGDNQDIRIYGKLNEFFPFTMMSMYISSLALCGMPFMSGFYSKDLIMEMIYFSKINLIMLLIIIISLMLTISYTFRMINYLFYKKIHFCSLMSMKEDLLMNLSMMILMILSILSGSLLNWLFFYKLELSILVMKLKLLTLILCLSGLLIGWLMILKIIKMKKLMLFLSSMWFLNFFYVYMYMIPMKLMIYLYNIDKTWFEFSKKNMFMNMLQNFKKKSLFYQYKINMFLSLFMVMMILFMLMM